MRFAWVAVFAAVASVAGGQALAASGGELQVVEAGSALFPDRLYVLTTPRAQEAPSAADLTVTENGKPVKGLAVSTAASADGIGTVLMIDSSNSMKGSISDAMEAARTFAARNPGQPLSVIFFNAKPSVAIGLTTERDQIRKVLAKAPKLAEGTHIFDALAAAVAQVRGSSLSAARIVLLSDGDDVGSFTTLDSALTQLEQQNIRVFTVGIASPDFVADDLERIADTTGGTYAEATRPESLTKIYDELGFRLGNEYLLSYRSTAAPNANVDVQVTLKGAEPVSFSYQSPSTGTGGPYTPALRDRLLQSWLLVPLVVALVLGLVVYTTRSLLSLRSNQALVARLGEFVTLPAEEQASERRKEVDALLAAVGQRKARKRSWRWLEGFSEDVDVAQIKYEPRKMVWISIFAGLAIAVVGGALLSPLWVFAAVAPPILLNLFVRGKARKTRDDFGEQLPENLDVLASALRAGHSLAGAIGVVADEAPEPSKREFTRVVTDEQLGIPLDEALEVTAQRMQNTDIDQVAVLALVQREAGGNTAEVLDQVTANIRARMDIRRLVKVLTAQGKFSSVVVACVPLGIFAFLLLVNPDHLDPLFHDPLGQVASVMAIIMTAAGFYVIRRIISIEL